MNTLFVAWRPQESFSGWRPVGRLEYDNGRYSFRYTKGAQQSPFCGFPKMENLTEVYESDDLLPIFSNRLLPKLRPEYEDFLRWCGFDPANPPDPISILGVTEGIRQTDAIELFPCPVLNRGFANKFFLHGIHLLDETSLNRIKLLQANEPLLLYWERLTPTNEYALGVYAHGERKSDETIMIGYLPRYLTGNCFQLIAKCGDLTIYVEKVNSDSPLSNRVLCRLESCWPSDFNPCETEEFQPIA